MKKTRQGVLDLDAMYGKPKKKQTEEPPPDNANPFEVCRKCHRIDCTCPVDCWTGRKR